MVKHSIQNRSGKRIAVLVDERQQGMFAVVMHGHGGFKEQPHIEAVSRAMNACGYTTVRFDATNSIGESDGRIEDATLAGNITDLEDVIEWARLQPWYREPFVLLGHSLGSMCCIMYADRHPMEVMALAPMASVVSGVLFRDALPSAIRKHWQRTGWYEHKSVSRPGFIKRIPWTFVEELCGYDVLAAAARLHMSAFFVAGSLDSVTPQAHQKKLYDAWSGPKEFHVIKGSEHTFRAPDHIRELEEMLASWAAQLNVRG